MSSMDAAPGMDELKDLQRRVNHESIKQQFRPKLIGGLNEEDVAQYIEHIEGQFRKLEQENKKYMDENFALKKKLEIQDEEFRTIQDSVESSKHKLNFYMCECKNKDIALKTLTEESIAEIKKLQEEMQHESVERHRLEEQLSQSNMEMEQAKSYAANLDENKRDVEARLAEMMEKNQLLEEHVSDLESERAVSASLKEELDRVADESRERSRQLSESVLELSQLNDYASELEENNRAVEAKLASMVEKNQLLEEYISEMSEENNDSANLKAELERMTDEGRERNKLLSESMLELSQVKDYASVLEETNNEMKIKLDEFENRMMFKEVECDKLIKACQELKEQVEQEIAKNEKQNMYLEMSKQKIFSLEATLSDNITELETLRAKSEKAEQELTLEKARVSSSIINSFKDELENIYKKIEFLESEAEQHVRSINELQQQMSAEQQRASKAESNASEYSKLVESMKQKLYSEQEMLEAQLKRMLEGKTQIQTEINECILNIK
ncbi:MAG: hypothetical protein AAGU76_07240 [Sedimentibacter sp.]|uniref:hypothetical protein n=1 Tax=Sedimentibacter sp. TaxID=1960295 RepID=UPI0031594904